MILDTCALLWLAQGGGELSPAALARIADAPVVHVSAIPGFGVGLKRAQGRLVLPARPLEWFRGVAEHHDLSVLPVDLDAAVRATELPAVHADPVDRIIVATAELRGWPVVTRDAVFSRYGIEVVG